MQNLSEIDTNRIEGRLLIAALVFITESKSNKTPEEVLQLVTAAADAMYDNVPLPDPQPVRNPTFEEELRSLINKYSKESASNTPDFILSSLISNVLTAYADAVNARDKWYGIAPVPGTNWREKIES